MCHDEYTTATIPARASFCFQCGVWRNSEMGLRMHVLQHVKEPSITYGPIMIDSGLSAVSPPDMQGAGHGHAGFHPTPPAYAWDTNKLRS
ncbi:uncharacterized protein M421DRAFT_78392 [Didymella exigua CBS 183.55]|uniref:C2H2-type domain-containing protein n=1 Tax=Didymella exigua CBS 183.55 TaxID=1150837 RepID=A0A6A5R5D5_9PLEO|nr:uncharacterized protein M421DRAFT_78392 [Didymella exigua CBS 183.55]KAF1922390.1 hypothetical protein M421DRAFT_78392 [Didymella exigua CBS 183.55]